jgi:hypothetical protein
MLTSNLVLMRLGLRGRSMASCGCGWAKQACCFCAAENDIVKYYDAAPSLTLVILVN